MRVGDKVIAIGNPLGLGGSVSSGIVSGLNRDIRTTPFDDFIQTDAAINHGNSGGPLFDRRGEVIGINTAIYSPTATSGSIGISFALPINDAKFVIEQTLQYGRVRAGWLGISMQSVTPDIAEAIGLGIPRGSIVAGVERRRPGGAGRGQEGDVIMSIGTMTPRNSRALWRAIAIAPLGKPIELTVWRDGRVLTVSPTVREMAAAPDPDAPADSAIRTVAAVPFTPASSSPRSPRRRGPIQDRSRPKGRRGDGRGARQPGDRARPGRRRRDPAGRLRAGRQAART